MSRRVVALVALLFGSAATAQAQERIIAAPPELSAARRARAESLAVAEETLRQRLEVRQAQLQREAPLPVRESAELLDTVRTGGLVLVRAQADSSVPIDRAGAAAWRLLQRRYGDALADVPARPIHIVRHDTSDAVQQLPPGAVLLEADAPIDELALRIADRVPVPLPDAAFLGWVHGALVLDSLERSGIEARYRQLAVHADPLARDCFAGEAAACGRAFGLGEPAVLYPALADRQRAVLRLQTTNLGPWQSGADACLRGDDEWCTRVLTDAALAELAIVMSPANRQDLARFAVRTGGAQGYARLLRARGQPIDAQLAAAAGQPIERVLRGWREAVIAGRPTPMALRPGVLLATLGWIGVAIAAAAGSTRWRLA